jgi:hypothetical protein
MDNPMRSDTWLIIEVALILAVLGFISFWKAPVYEKGTAMAMVVFADALKVLLGYKFGRAMPQQTSDPRPGQASQTQSTTTVKTEAPVDTAITTPTESPLPLH